MPGCEASRKKFLGRAETKVGRGQRWRASEYTQDPSVGRISRVLL